jgi:hypothetical protein
MATLSRNTLLQTSNRHNGGILTTGTRPRKSRLQEESGKHKFIIQFNDLKNIQLVHIENKFL